MADSCTVLWTNDLCRGLIRGGFTGQRPTVLGLPGTPIRFDAPLPGDRLERLTFTSRRGERKLKHLENGRLLRAVGLQGSYRLAPSSAGILARNLTDWRPAA